MILMNWHDNDFQGTGYTHSVAWSLLELMIGNELAVIIAFEHSDGASYMGFFGRE